MYNDLKDSEKDYPMDLLWLITLYLPDISENLDPQIVLESNLMKSAWGAMEIWKRYFKDIDVTEKLNIFKKHLSANVYKQICVELYFKEEISDCEDLPSVINKYNSFIKDLYKCKTRGRSNISKNDKWIYSVLYGNWRDQVDVSSVFDNRWKTERDKKGLLKALRYIPSVEIKMAILDYLSKIVKWENRQIDVNCLTWALKDQHPWVIRSALPLFQGRQDIVKDKIRRNINMKIYPGIFDLAIELSRLGFNDIEYSIDKINDYESEMLKIAISQEHNV